MMTNGKQWAALLLPMMALAAVLRGDEVNLAQGRPVVASGPTTGSPALVTDGDAATYTHPTSAGVIGFYYQIDLGREYPLEQIHLYSQINANPNRLSKVRMSVYSDGGGVPGVERWKHVIRPGGENNPQGGVDILTAGLDPAGTFRGRYVRITNDGLTTNCPDVAEIEVFEAPAPAVTFFSVADGNITATGRPGLPSSTRLVWKASGFTGLSIEPALGVQTSAEGSVEISPAVRTTYTLTAVNGAGQTVRRVTVGVDETEQPVRLSEFLASNAGGIADDEGRRHDWVELHNPNPFDVNLRGYHLSDDPANPRKWEMPDYGIPALGHAVVWASNGAGKAAPFEVPHASFALSTSGEALTLTGRDGRTVVSLIPRDYPEPALYPVQYTDHSYGLSGGSEGYFQVPTPGAENGPRFDGVVAPLVFSVARGIHESSQNLIISCPTSGVEIRYTVNGAEPTATTGTVLPSGGFIGLSTTRVIRAAAFRAGWVPSDVATHTYLFPSSLSTSGWLNPGLTTNPAYAPLMSAALRQVPSMCLTVGPVTINGATDRVGSLEWIDPAGGPGFQIPCGAKLFGGAFTNFAKKSYRISFKGEYGAGKLRFPLFAGHDRGLAAATEFDQIELRNGSHDMVDRGFYLSNMFTDATMLDMGSLAPHGRFVHLYLNGSYWGVYHLRERWSAEMVSSYYGGRDSDYESVNGNLNVGGWADPGLPYDGGTGAVWTEMKTLARSGGDVFGKLRPLLDVPQYIDFMTMWMFGKSEDEYRVTGPRGPGHGAKFVLNDADGYLYLASYGGPGSDRTGRATPGKSAGDGPGSLFSMLYRDGGADYRMLLADRIHRAMVAPGGAMTPAANAARLAELCAQIDRAIIPECARWNYRSPVSWQSACDGALNWLSGTRVGSAATFTVPRTTTVLGHYTTAGFYPAVAAPVAVPPPGVVAAGTAVTFTGAPAGAAVLYGWNGPDPRVAGAPVPNAPLVTAASGGKFRVPSAAGDGMATAPIPGLAAWWRFDGNAQEEGGNFHGAFTNGALSVAPGQSGSACLELDGTNDYLFLGNPAGLQITGQITLSAWVKPDVVTGLRNIINKGHDTATPNGEITLRINGGAYQCGYWAGSAGSVMVSGPATGPGSAAADVGTWHHVAGLWDGTAWRLYRDGVLLASVPSATGAVTVPVIGWAVGARGNGAERYFDGQIDEVRIYRRGLTASEVAALAANRTTSEQPVWTETAFDDSGWQAAVNGLGFAPAGGPLAAAVRQDVGSVVRGVSASVYSRYPFRLTSAERAQTAALTLRVRADDGFVAWLNGTRVASRNAPPVVDGRSTATAETPDAVALAGESVDLTPWLALLRDGENVLALQMLNVSADDGDALLAVELDSFRGTPGLSPLARTYDSASPPVTTVNTVVRSRSWVPSTRSWSALSETFHQVGPHACPPGWLVCSELHFNPRGDDDGEFIELLNAGPGAVNLRGARFVAGISFGFPANRDKLLAPGERLVLADSAISFQGVHGWAAAFGGVFRDNLSNQGERIALVSADGQTVLLDFTYDGKDPWPEEADSGGRSLVLVGPRAGMDLNDPANWRASVADHGNPNADDAAAFHGDPRADADGDGRSAWEEFALGTSDLRADPDPVAVPVADPLPGVAVDHAANADAAAVRMAGSNNLMDWTLPMVLRQRRALPDGRVRSFWSPAAPEPRAFFRVQIPLADP
jgi:hypothetical protein